MNTTVDTHTENEARSIKAYLSDAKVRQKFEEVLGKKAQGFLASVLQVTNQPHLKNAVPITVMNAAMMAATLDLPINNNLGFAYIVPYKRKFRDNKNQWHESNEAQFQMGYKGFIQLAQRSGQFHRIATTAVYQGQLIKADPLLGFEFDWSIEAKDKPIGYVAFFQLINGFTAELYMSKADVLKHAGNYSQSYKYAQELIEKGQKPSSIWHDNFDAMALKTVLKLLLSKQAPLSIEMQTAQLADQSIVRDVDNQEFEYIDHSEAITELSDTKIVVPDNEFPVLIEQIKADALSKEYVFAEYQLTEAQRKAIEVLS